jgi:nucleoid DNA-binding protein/cell division protein FtsN
MEQQNVMNRDDLLRRCVDRGVADETSVEAVSHLFYVYLLTALQRGQRVEIPNFGTFGTRVVGVKKTRRMPYFEVEKDLADKVNERFRQLKTLVTGKITIVPSLVEEEYTGKESPFDVRLEGLGKEMLLDTRRDVPIEAYELAAQQQQVSPPKEKELMPKLNLRDQVPGDEDLSQTPEPEGDERFVTPATLREFPSERRLSPILQIALAILAIAAILFALNNFGIIHLWGKKTPVVVESLPEPTPAAGGAAEGVERQPGEAGAQPGEAEPTPLPGTPGTGAAKLKEAAPTSVPGVKPKPTVKPGTTALPGGFGPPSGSGSYTIQVSSWATRAKANAQAAQFSQGGYSAFVQEAVVDGTTWYRVRIGRYSTVKEASEIAGELRSKLGDGFWVGRIQSP